MRASGLGRLGPGVLASQPRSLILAVFAGNSCPIGITGFSGNCLPADTGRTHWIHPFMTTIRLKENEPFDVALRRFKRTIEKLGLLTELRAREFYEKPTSERKRKKAAAVKRHYKRVRSQQLPKRMY